MADHARKQIRAAVKLLLTGLATTGSNVFVNRDTSASPYAEAELPALNIATGTDDVIGRSFGSQVSAANRTRENTLTLTVTVTAKAVPMPDDTLDQACLEVEKALGADIFLGGLATDARLASTDFTPDEAGDKPVATAKMTFDIDYWCDDSDPSVVTSS